MGLEYSISRTTALVGLCSTLPHTDPVIRCFRSSNQNCLLYCPRVCFSSSANCEDVTDKLWFNRVISSFVGGCGRFVHSGGMTRVCRGGMGSGMLPVAAYVWSCSTLAAFSTTGPRI